MVKIIQAKFCIKVLILVFMCGASLVCERSPTSPGLGLYEVSNHKRYGPTQWIEGYFLTDDANCIWIHLDYTSEPEPDVMDGYGWDRFSIYLTPSNDSFSTDKPIAITWGCWSEGRLPAHHWLVLDKGTITLTKVEANHLSGTFELYTTRYNQTIKGTFHLPKSLKADFAGFLAMDALDVLGKDAALTPVGTSSVTAPALKQWEEIFSQLEDKGNSPNEQSHRPLQSPS